jgi:hypothetical protein
MIVPALLALAAAPVKLGDQVPFEPAAESFSDAAACRAFLAARADAARAQGFEAVEGPYRLAAADVRVHTVRAEGKGHRIVETRCLDKALSARTWTHNMVEDDQPFSVESAARAAPWLKKAPGQQQ